MLQFFIHWRIDRTLSSIVFFPYFSSYRLSICWFLFHYSSKEIRQWPISARRAVNVFYLLLHRFRVCPYILHWYRVAMKLWCCFAKKLEYSYTLLSLHHFTVPDHFQQAMSLNYLLHNSYNCSSLKVESMNTTNKTCHFCIQAIVTCSPRL